jgi:head-tail adaptor
VIEIDATATIDTWYRPDIKADCRILLCDTEQMYDIISEPEDIDMRHQFLQFKVRKVGGKA